MANITLTTSWGIDYDGIHLHYTVLMPLESIYFSMFETESRDLGQTERRHRNAMTLNAIIEIHLVEG